jgi:hypothetical protein
MLGVLHILRLAGKLLDRHVNRAAADQSAPGPDGGQFQDGCANRRHMLLSFRFGEAANSVDHKTCFGRAPQPSCGPVAVPMRESDEFQRGRPGTVPQRNRKLRDFKN